MPRKKNNRKLAKAQTPAPRKRKPASNEVTRKRKSFPVLGGAKGAGRKRNTEATVRAKRARAKSKRTPKRTYAYIRSLIWQAYSHKIKNYQGKTFLRNVSKVYQYCIELGSRCTNKLLLKYYKKLTRKKRKKIPGPPKAPLPPPQPPQKKKFTYAYVKALLWRERKPDFSSFKDPALAVAAKELYQLCKSKGSDCTDEFLLAEYAALKQEPFPAEAVKILQENFLFDPSDYFTINTVPFNQLGAVAPTIWITSPMIMPAPHEFLITSYYDNTTGDVTNGYNTWFKDWVDWCNDYIRDNFGSLESGLIFFKFLQPVYNKSQKRWDFEIIICTAKGEADSFGYSPAALPGEPRESSVKGEDAGKTTKPEKPKGKDEAVKQPPAPGTEDLVNQIHQLQKELKNKQQADKDAETIRKMNEAILKDRELKRLRAIKKELEKTLKLYLDASQTEAASKIIADLNEIIDKIKKLA